MLETFVRLAWICVADGEFEILTPRRHDAERVRPEGVPD